MLDKQFWENNYQTNQTGWDVGYAATPIKEYIDQLNNKNIKILVPGAGNAYEVEYLYNSGFINTYLLDFAPSPIKNFKKRNPFFPDNQIIYEDFFKHKREYNLIIEHTFFTSLLPHLRPSYVEQIHRLLKPNGKLVGLLFNHDFKKDYPPFGGSKEEYIQLFNPLFNIVKIETAFNSIKPRAGKELFFLFSKK